MACSRVRQEERARVRQISSYTALFAVPWLGGGLLWTPDDSVDTAFGSELV